MNRNFTLENDTNKLNESKENKGLCVGPSKHIIRNLLAYSKALNTLKVPANIAGKQKTFHFILN